MSIKHRQSLKNALRATTALFGFVAAAGLLSQPAGAITINNNYTPSQVVDTTNITGVGQMVIDEQNGFIGLCTATLINPRTVIFASHCVNENPSGTGFMPATGYGKANGGLPIGFFFNANNNQAGNSAIGQWLNGVSGGPRDLTRTGNNAYNSNFVVYDTACCTFGVGNNFFQADVAMAALDTPAVGIPTWTTLFSPLSAPVHATIEGYGNNGTGSAGANGGIDFRRRVAENIVSMLGSLADIDAATGFPGDPQPYQANLYLADFNNPNYKVTNTQAQNLGDFNIFNDLATTKEGMTAPGDSGGPLVIDHAFAKPTIAAVLSGGITWSGQKSGGYGTQSFYQPLYLYWDWIVANNPYKYVGAKAGNGNWTDPSHWVMNLDPAYVTIGPNGQLVNGLPTTAALGGADIAPGFGSVCFFGDCVNIVNGVETNPTPIQPNPAVASDPAQVQFVSEVAKVSASTIESSPAQASISDVSGDPSTPSIPGTPTYSSNTNPATWTNPEATGTVGGQTIAGLPGTTLTVVPNDTNANAATGAPARYYDVTLAAAGTTTLSGASITIDRLTINGPNAALTIASGAGLSTLIDTTMYAGNLQVDGSYLSVGDIALMGGVLSGSGRVFAPYTTAVLGAIAPGTVGTTGILTITGNVVLSSGSGLLIDMSPTATDRLDVFGQISLGGTVVFNPVGGYVPRWHNSAVFATGNTITGTFDHVPDTIPGVLYPTVSTVTVPGFQEEVATFPGFQEEVVTFQAATFASLLTNPTADQTQIGHALDVARDGSYADMTALYDAIDPLADGALASALEDLAPDAARALPFVSQLIVQGYTGFVWQHLGEMGIGGADGDQTVFHVQTGALKLTQNSSVGSYQTRGLLTGLGQLGGGPASALYPASPIPAQANNLGGALDLPKGMGGFLFGSSLDGAVKIGGGGGTAGVDGFIIAGGVDLPLTDHFRAGVSIALAQASATLRNSPATTNTNSTQGVLYGSYDADNDWFIKGFAGDSGQTMHTRRDVVVGGTTFHLTGHTDGSSPMGGLQVGKHFDVEGIRLAPAIGLQYQRSQISGYTETGGVAAMTFNPYAVEEFDLRAGFDAYGMVDLNGVVLKPNLHAFLVHNTDGANVALQSSFAAAPGALMSFALAPYSTLWAELGVGAQVNLGDSVTLGVHYDADVGRSDSRYGAWTGSLRVTF